MASAERHEGAGAALSLGASRAFRVLGVQQVALASLDRSRLHRLWVDCLGLSSVGTFTSAAENVDEEIISAGVGLATVEIDLMQPLDPAQRPKTHEPALHHLGLWIDDLRAAVAWLVTHGVRLAPGGIRRGAGGHEVCFIHPRPSEYFPICGEGVLIELVQAPAHVHAEYTRVARGER